MQREAFDRFRRDSTGQRQRAEAGEIRAGREQREQRGKRPPSLEGRREDNGFGVQ